MSQAGLKPAFLMVLPMLLWADPAGTFEQSRNPDNLSVCLYWEDREVTVHLHEDCSADVSKQNCETAVWTSLDTWNLPPCSDFKFVSGGTTAITEVGFDWDHNVNLIIWRESAWAHEAEALAMTTTTYDRNSGKIVDSDVEFNGRDYTFTTAESVNTLVDIANTVTHEAGHMLGLDHCEVYDATMYGYAPKGEIAKRDLSQDDIDGLCYLYPVGGETPFCPDYKYPIDDGGCVCAAQGASRRTSSVILIFVLFLLLRSMKRQKEVRNP